MIKINNIVLLRFDDANIEIPSEEHIEIVKEILSDLKYLGIITDFKVEGEKVRARVNIEALMDVIDFAYDTFNWMKKRMKRNYREVIRLLKKPLKRDILTAFAYVTAGFLWSAMYHRLYGENEGLKMLLRLTEERPYYLDITASVLRSLMISAALSDYQFMNYLLDVLIKFAKSCGIRF